MLGPYWRRHTPGVLRLAAFGRMLRVGIPIGVQLALEMWGFIAVSLVLPFVGFAVAGTSKAALCRCGASERKPYCDGAHRTCGFRAE